jgi:hypothetical protein
LNVIVMYHEKVVLESLILSSLIERTFGKSCYAHSPILATAWPPTRLAAPSNVGLRSELELRVSRGWLKTQVLVHWVCSTFSAPIVIGRVRYTHRAAARLTLKVVVQRRTVGVVRVEQANARELFDAPSLHHRMVSVVRATANI